MARQISPEQPPATADAGAPAGRERKFNAEELGQRLLRLLEPLRVQSLSLHDSDGELLWLNEGAFGPDEHGYVLDALDLFLLEGHRQFLDRRLEDGRRALFLCARTPLGERSGLALAVVEERSTPAIERELSASRVAALMRRFSMLLAPPLAPQRRESSAADRTARPAAAAAPAPVRPAAARTPPPAAAGLAAAGIGPIHARLYARLRPGGTTRRYEATGAPFASVPADQELAARVIEHLQRRREQYRQDPASIAVPLGAGSVIERGFLSQLRPLLLRAQLDEGSLGFCLPAVAWAEAQQATEQFIAECAQCGCFVALDDFNLERPGVGLLRSSALRCLKLDPALLAGVMSDRFSQASVAAIVQAARVLGLYCVAKQVDSAPLAQWLAAAGIEFSDGISRGETIGATTKSARILAL